MSDDRVAQLLESAPLLYALAKDALLSRGRWPDTCEQLVPPPSGLDLSGTRIGAALDDELGLLTPILVATNSWEWTPGRDCSALLLRHADRFESAVRTVVEAPAAQWWWEPLPRDRQTWLNPWDDDPPVPFDVDLSDGFTDGTTPREALWTSTAVGSLPGLTLFFAWDTQVRTPVAVWRVPVPITARVFAVRTADDWRALCLRYPQDTTHRRAQTWQEDLGVRDARIVTPAWERVAEEWDGVHMSVAGLLTTNCRVLPLGAGAVTSVMRWHTEATVWFRPAFGSTSRVADWSGDLPYAG